MDSLFGHLAIRLHPHPENIATEALSYVLGQSRVASDSFVRLINQRKLHSELKLHVESGQSFSTQVTGDDQSRPDLIGINENGEKQIIIEAKFWAGLTNNQPLAYLKQLPSTNNGLLLFIAPHQRFNTLWPELIQRCKDDYQIGDTEKSNEAFWYAKVSPTALMGLISWGYLLQYLESTLKEHGEPNRVSDVQQLLGLTKRMDGLAFIPLRSEELSQELASRYCDFTSLVDEVAWKARDQGYCSLNNLKPTGGVGFYGRYMKIGNTGAYLSFDARKWAHIRNTPLWLGIYGVEWKDKTLSRQALSSYETGESKRAIIENDEFLIPLDLPIGQEKDNVIESLVLQISKVHKILKDVELKNADNVINSDS